MAIDLELFKTPYALLKYIGKEGTGIESDTIIRPIYNKNESFLPVFQIIFVSLHPKYKKEIWHENLQLI